MLKPSWKALFGMPMAKSALLTQLIDAFTDEHLWAETYDREFADIFDIESDIAMNIANALEAEFSLAERERIDKPPTDSLEAYALYLKARALVSNINPLSPPEFYQYLDHAIELDPDFALAHAVKASSYAISINNRVQVNGLTFEEMGKVALEHAAR